MEWKDEDWLLAVFLDLIEKGDQEMLGRFLENNPNFIELLSKTVVNKNGKESEHYKK